MADLGNADRDIEQALTVLKKGSQLIKYGRKGKPKVYPFRLSNDETTLIWISSAGERNLKLASISRIIPGQRTAVFQRYLRPEKDYLSFSLIYNNGKRSLDLICKDKVEAEAWIGGLKALVLSGQGGRSKIDGWCDGGLYLDNNRDLTSNSASDSSVSDARISSPEVSFSSYSNISPKGSTHSERAHVVLDQTNMQLKVSNSDTFRVSVSSVPSTSSHGSGTDDCDALADVYIWGEVICDSYIKVGPDRNSSSLSIRTDILLPKPLESTVVLDVHHIACGVHHTALVTKQGEVFTWGEESGGRLGHGVSKNVTQPCLLESVSSCSFDFVACGEFHTCAVTAAGEVYSWGDGTHNAGLLGHGTDVSHWIPKRISGPLEGLHISTVSCGPWHTALITSTGQLFTFGDGTFGALGHGDRENVYYPREVDSLLGLRTISVACGVWHTAAAVEVIVTQSSAIISSGKLFTWGDGDKNRLGQGDKEPRLKPTCVPALIEYDFHKVSCGHSLTVGLTTSGRVFTMGSTVYGQLGNPNSDGKLPCLVEEKINRETVEEISCGAYHVAVLTSKNEVFTWGKGANGRLGHGDVEDRKTPTLVDALKDRHVKYISCGSNYTTSICVHKWVSGTDQSQCSTCRQAFGFTRKRHNCYNCGLVHCHACSSRKALRAALSPNPSKPYRVCDSCFAKLNKLLESSVNNRRNVVPRISGENKDRLDKADLRLAKSGIPSNLDLIKLLDNKAAKQGKKSDTYALDRMSQAHFLSTTAIDIRRAVSKPVSTTPSGVSSRSVSPFSRKSSPPRSATPVPTTSGLSFSKSIADSLKKTHDLMNLEIIKLRQEVERLRRQCEIQEAEVEKSRKKTEEAMAVAAEEATKSKAAKEVIKMLTAQLKDMVERLPPGTYDTDNIKLAYPPNGTFFSNTNGHSHSRFDSTNGSLLASPNRPNSTSSPSHGSAAESLGVASLGSVHNLRDLGQGLVSSNGGCEFPDAKVEVNGKETGLVQEGESGTKPKYMVGPGVNGNNQVEAEWIEQYEPGVYITLVALPDGTRDLKRVRFSRRRFGEHQAETWWSEKCEKVYERYNVRGSDKSSSTSGQPGRLSAGGAESPASQL